MKVFVKSTKNKKILKFTKKFKKYKKEVIFESIENSYINDKNEYEDIEEEEENNEDEYEYEYDEGFNNNNYKPQLYSKTSVGGKKGKGKIIEKYDASHSMTPSRVIMKKEREYTEKVHGSDFSIFDYSKIMQEYKNITKNQKKLYYFNLNYRTEKIKLKYRASDYKKFEVKNLFQLTNLISKGEYVLVMKILDDVYFFMETMDDPDSYFYRNVYFMTKDEIISISSNQNLKLLTQSKKIQLKDCFSFFNNQNEGILEFELTFKNNTINNKKLFYVNDLEIFELTKQKFKYYLMF